MQKFSQKYAIAYFIEQLPSGYTFLMQNWPPHVTLADVFAIDSDIDKVINQLSERFSDYLPVSTNATNDEWFGENKNVRVMLIQKTDSLQLLHEDVVKVLETNNVRFNNPEFVRDGFKPHSTIKDEPVLHTGDKILIDSLSVIDMFPGEDPMKRKIIATIHFKK